MFLSNFYILYSQALYQLLFIASILYFIGLFGLMGNHKNFLVTILFIEIMYVSIFLYFISVPFYLNSQLGQIYALVILIAAACESAIGLGILILIYKNNEVITLNFYKQLKSILFFLLSISIPTWVFELFKSCWICSLAVLLYVILVFLGTLFLFYKSNEGLSSCLCFKCVCGSFSTFMDQKPF